MYTPATGAAIEAHRPFFRYPALARRCRAPTPEERTWHIARRLSTLSLLMLVSLTTLAASAGGRPGARRHRRHDQDRLLRTAHRPELPLRQARDERRGGRLQRGEQGGRHQRAQARARPGGRPLRSRHRHRRRQEADPPGPGLHDQRRRLQQCRDRRASRDRAGQDPVGRVRRRRRRGDDAHQPLHLLHRARRLARELRPARFRAQPRGQEDRHRLAARRLGPVALQPAAGGLQEEGHDARGRRGDDGGRQ